MVAVRRAPTEGLVGTVPLSEITGPISICRRLTRNSAGRLPTKQKRTLFAFGSAVAPAPNRYQPDAHSIVAPTMAVLGSGAGAPAKLTSAASWLAALRSKWPKSWPVIRRPRSPSAAIRILDCMTWRPRSIRFRASRRRRRYRSAKQWRRPEPMAQRLTATCAVTKSYPGGRRKGAKRGERWRRLAKRPQAR